MLTVYSKNHCPFCDMTKRLLESKNINYVEVKIDENTDARDFILGEGHRTVPQIYLHNELFVKGGYQGLAKLTDEELMNKLEK